MAYRFRPVTPADLGLVNDWLARPHVAEWWNEGGEPARISDSDLADPLVRLWIVELEGRPFAYVQDYEVHGQPGDHFHDRPPGARGIDQFIGEPDLLGLGHGTGLVRQHAGRLLAEGAPCVVTDPDPANLRAVRAYRKAGFESYRRLDSPVFGQLLLMSKARP